MPDKKKQKRIYDQRTTYFDTGDGAHCTYHSVLHSVNNQPAIRRDNGEMIWYDMGVIHRDQGPAMVYPDGRKYWLQHGVYHREGGPAVIHPGRGNEYWIRGEKQ